MLLMVSNYHYYWFLSYYLGVWIAVGRDKGQETWQNKLTTVAPRPNWIFPTAQPAMLKNRE